MLNKFKKYFKERKGFKVKVEAYLESSRTSVWSFFVKITNGYRGKYRPKLRSVTECGIREFGITNSQNQKIYMIQINKRTKTKLKKKENKEKEVNIYKLTFYTINNIIFIANICFD